VDGHYREERGERLVDSVDLTHGRLDVEGLDVLPVLLQEGDKEVDGHDDVLDDEILSETDVTNGNSDTENLLKLELDGTLDGVDLLHHVLSGEEESWELSSLVQSWSQKTRNESENGLRGEEGVVLLGELLDELLVLVEFLQSLNITEVNSVLLGLVDVMGISQNAEVHSWLDLSGDLDGSGETLILLWIVVLESNLELDGLNKSSLGIFAGLEDSVDGLTDGFSA
jgi:hypothetical protein